MANNLFAYAKVNPGMPAIFVVLDSDLNDKRVSINTMRKILLRQVNLFSIVISDCTDSETR